MGSWCTYLRSYRMHFGETVIQKQDNIFLMLPNGNAFACWEPILRESYQQLLRCVTDLALEQ